MVYFFVVKISIYEPLKYVVMKKIDIILLLTIIMLSSCGKDLEVGHEEVIPDKITFYGNITGGGNDGYHLFWFSKIDKNVEGYNPEMDSYFLFFEIGKYGDYYKEYNLSNFKLNNYKIGSPFPIRVSSCLRVGGETNIVEKDTTIILAYNNKLIINL